MSELSWLRSLIKHNVAAKHGSSKPLTWLTSNDLWLLELRIKKYSYIGLHTQCIMGYVQIVYTKLATSLHSPRKFSTWLIVQKY